jgi:hypothetical protein
MMQQVELQMKIGVIMIGKPKRLTLTVPPKRGPNPQGLNIDYNTVRTIKSEKTINGRNRQGSNPKHR